MRKLILLFIAVILNAKIIGYGDLKDYGLTFDGKFAIDKNGKEVAKAQNYFLSFNFSEGLAPAIVSDGKVCFIDTKGSIVIEPKFDDALPFSEGLAAVRLNEKWGFIDKKGILL